MHRPDGRRDVRAPHRGDRGRRPRPRLTARGRRGAHAGSPRDAPPGRKGTAALREHDA